MAGGKATLCLLLIFHVGLAIRITENEGLAEKSDDEPAGEAASAFQAEAEVDQELSADSMGELQAWLKEMTPDQAKSVHELRKAVADGQKAEDSLSCEKIPEEMGKLIGQMKDEFHPACTDKDSCDFSIVNVGVASTGQQFLTSLAGAADKKKCLDEAMGASEVQEKLHDFLSFMPKVLRSASSPEGRSRVQEAYLQLVSFQEGVPELAKVMADRKLLFETDVDFAEDCPAPCQMCKSDGAFGFQCLLKTKNKDSIPDLSGHQVICEAPMKRGWWRKYRYGKPCTVPDLKEAAVQHVHIAAVVSCAADSILMSLSSALPSDRRKDMYRICLSREQGNAVSKEEEQQYETQKQERSDELIPRSLSVAMNSILTLGLASGLAGVRAATRGNRITVLLEGGSVDFVAPFAKHLGELTIRAEDRAMYGSREHVRRLETLGRLGACESVYSLQAENAFIEGSKPLSQQSMDMLQEALKEKQELNQEAQEEEKHAVKKAAMDYDPYDPYPAPAPPTPHPRPLRWGGLDKNSMAETILIGVIGSSLLGGVLYLVWFGILSMFWSAGFVIAWGSAVVILTTLAVLATFALGSWFWWQAVGWQYGRDAAEGENPGDWKSRRAAKLGQCMHSIQLQSEDV